MRISDWSSDVCSSDLWLVSRVSANSADHIGLSPEQMLGRPISGIFSAEAVHSLRNRITLLRGPDAVERIFSLALMEGVAPFDVAVHFSGSLVVIEAEQIGRAACRERVCQYV